jgi:hypothetical protein
MSKIDVISQKLSFFKQIIWSFKKKVVPLHAFSSVRVRVFHIYTRRCA